MQFRLRDINPTVVAAWRRVFDGCPDVIVAEGDILAEPADAIVSPANSFGFMDGGIDLAYSRRVGWDLEARLQERLRSEHDGELPVGQRMEPEACAGQMRYAYRTAHVGERFTPADLMESCRNQFDLAARAPRLP